LCLGAQNDFFVLTDLFGEETANKKELCDIITRSSEYLLLPTRFGTIWTVGEVVCTKLAIRVLQLTYMKRR
jgi:hypothetical protein